MIVDDPVLGELEFDDEGYAGTKVSLGNRTIELDINFEDAFDEDAVASITPLVTDIHALDQRAQEAIREDLDSGDEDGATRLYCDHHRSEFEEAKLRGMLNLSAAEPVTDEAFLRAFHLVRIGIYPESEDAAVVCDYTISREVTNYLIAVSFDQQGAASDVSLES